MINLFIHVDDRCAVSDDQPEFKDTLCKTDSNEGEDQRTTPSAENVPEDMADWFASDEAAFWMGM